MHGRQEQNLLLTNNQNIQHKNTPARIARYEYLETSNDDTSQIEMFKVKEQQSYWILFCETNIYKNNVK